MAGLGPATHVLDGARLGKSWVAGLGPAMTRSAFVRGHASVISRTGITRAPEKDAARVRHGFRNPEASVGAIAPERPRNDDRPRQLPEALE